MPPTTPCWYHSLGRCNRGGSCRFSHKEETSTRGIGGKRDEPRQASRKEGNKRQQSSEWRSIPPPAKEVREAKSCSRKKQILRCGSYFAAFAGDSSSDSEDEIKPLTKLERQKEQYSVEAFEKDQREDTYKKLELRLVAFMNDDRSKYWGSQELALWKEVPTGNIRDQRRADVFELLELGLSPEAAKLFFDLCCAYEDVPSDVQTTMLEVLKFEAAPPFGDARAKKIEEV